MKPLKYILVAALVFWVLVQDRLPTGPDLGVETPRFEARATNGEVFDSDSLRGKTVVVDFWAGWCPACVASLPAIHEFHQNRLSDSSVELMTVHVPKGGSRATIEHYQQSQGYSFPVVLDRDARLVTSFKIESIPTLIIIAPDGRVHHVKNGQLRGNAQEGARRIEKWVERAAASVDG